MSEDTLKIEVDFPVPVEVRDPHFQKLVNVVSQICDEWEDAHPDQIMWPFGMGSKPLTNFFLVDEEHPMKFDDTVLHIEVTCRERYEDERRHRTWRWGYPLTWSNVLRLLWDKILHPRILSRYRFELFRIR